MVKPKLGDIIMQETYLISDTHFDHKNIIAYGERPFATVEEMNSILIENWNKIIKPEYLVIHAGDFALSRKDRVKEILNGLNGHKLLILGNHDNTSINYWKDVGFDEVSKYPICFRQFYWISHEPMFINEHMPYINIHGHTHQNSYENKQYFNISVEAIGYKPINFKDIAEYYQKIGEQE
jgi:calcineurin-like phosphoesterase family protein